MHPSTIFSSDKKENSRRLHPLVDSLLVVACTCGGTYNGYGGRGWRIRDRRRRDGRESEQGVAIIRHALVVKRTDSATLLFTICLLIVQQVLNTYNDAGDRKARRKHNNSSGAVVLLHHRRCYGDGLGLESVVLSNVTLSGDYRQERFGSKASFIGAWPMWWSRAAADIGLIYVTVALEG
ncbi:unnamed protein product [Sphagnum tenellum]